MPSSLPEARKLVSCLDFSGLTSCPAALNFSRQDDKTLLEHLAGRDEQDAPLLQRV